MPDKLKRWWLPTVVGLNIGSAQAAPIEGTLGSNAAAILVLLGVWALILGMRNLRELRYKRIVPDRQPVDGATETAGRGASR